MGLVSGFLARGEIGERDQGQGLGEASKPGVSRTKTNQAKIKSMDLNSSETQKDENVEDIEEKARLISQVLELQNTLEDLSSKVDNVKEENLRLKSENQVLGQYIENLMTASQVFQTTEEPRYK